MGVDKMKRKWRKVDERAGRTVEFMSDSGEVNKGWLGLASWLLRLKT
jgi:hypothetical protein